MNPVSKAELHDFFELGHASRLGVEFDSSVFMTNSLEHLDFIHCTRFNLGIWKRNENVLLSSWIKTCFDSLPEVELIDKAKSFRAKNDFFEGLFKHLGSSSSVLVNDLLRITGAFLEVSESPNVGIQLQKVRTDMCQAFHQDRCDLRLICTYFGLGTRFVPNSAVDRKDPAIQKEPRFSVRDLSQVRQLQTQWVGLMKGTGYPGNENQGIVHASPKISHLEAPLRYVFKLESLW